MNEITGKIKQKSNTFSAEQIANEFNSFFTNVGPFIAENIQPVSTSFTEYLKSFNDAISDSDLTIKEFETALKSLKRNKAGGIGIIDSNIIPDTYDEIKNI